VLYNANVLDRFFRPDQFELVLWIKLLANVCFCAGCLWGISDVRAGKPTVRTFLKPQGRLLAIIMAWLFGVLGLAAFAWMVSTSGGLIESYSTAYSGAFASSGYLVESPYLALPAVILLAISQQGRRLSPLMVMLALLFISPMLIQGILGARRGPTFFAVVTLWMAWHVYKQRRPSLLQTLGGVTALGFLVVALVVYRSNIYIGSSFQFDPHEYWQEVFHPVKAGPGDDYIDSSGLLLTSLKYGRHNWGTRTLVTFFVRPIPRQLWPSKYVDCGFEWLDSKVERFGYSDVEWQNAAGFIPIVGMTTCFDGSFFLDFSWFGLVGCYLAGTFFSYVWRMERQHGGFWQVAAAGALALSIFFPAQDFPTFLYRWLFACIPPLLLWWFFVRPHLVRVAATGEGARSGLADEAVDVDSLDEAAERGDVLPEMRPRRPPFAPGSRRSRFGRA